MIYKRILLKLSGEAFAGELDRGIDRNTLLDIASRVVKVFEQGVEIGIVVGGGNFWRGRDAKNFDRAIADSIGMMAGLFWPCFSVCCSSSGQSGCTTSVASRTSWPMSKGLIWRISSTPR